MAKKDFYKEYRKQTQHTLDLWKTLIILRQNLVKEIESLDKFMEQWQKDIDKSVSGDIVVSKKGR